MPLTTRKLLTNRDLVSLNDLGYRFGDKIGSGTFAKVFLAEHRVKNRCVVLACKVFDLSTAPPEYRDKFFPRELNIIMNISHPNIISLHSIQKVGRKVFIFMQYADNGDLLQHVQEFGPISEQLCRFWFRQIVSALQYLHGLNIAHRDLKCENILVSRHFNVKLADFGFARQCNDEFGYKQLSTTFCGSAAYTAPEIFSGHPYNPMQADVWSIGCILYILLNARMPFDDSNVSQLVRKQINRKWSFRKKMKKILTPGVISLVRKILEPDVARRIRLHAIANHYWLLENDNPTQAGDAFIFPSLEKN